MKYINFSFISLILVFSVSCTGELNHNESTMNQGDNLKEIIKNGFNEIIQYHIDKGELHARAAADARAFAKYLEDQTEYTRKKLSEVIKKINYETIQPNKYDVWPGLEIWRGTDNFESSVALTYDGEVNDLNDYGSIVVGKNEDTSDSTRILNVKKRKSIKIDLKKYPISLLGYYEGKFNNTTLYYAWIAYLWQDIEGFRCGMKVQTVQNNSIAIFSLNDFLDGKFSTFAKTDYGEKPVRINRFFPRKLSIIELYLRALQSEYPYHLLKNYWRYFERGDEFKEIVAYEFSTGIRSGKLSERKIAEIRQTKRHKDSKTTSAYLTAFTNKMIFEGWEEKLRPIEMPIKMNQDTYAFNIWTGTHWAEEQIKMIRKDIISNFEGKHGIRVCLKIKFCESI